MPGIDDTTDTSVPHQPACLNERCCRSVRTCARSRRIHGVSRPIRLTKAISVTMRKVTSHLSSDCVRNVDVNMVPTRITHFHKFISVILAALHHFAEEARFARAPDSDRGRGSKEESRNEEITPFGERNNIR